MSDFFKIMVLRRPKPCPHRFRTQLNSLPDDCLLDIFRRLNRLDDLVNCSKVCQRWRFLIAHRLVKVKYLLSTETDKYAENTIFIDEGRSLLDVNFLQLLPNLKILDLICAFTTNRYWIAVDVVSAAKHLRGIIFMAYTKNVNSSTYMSSIASYCEHPEMVAMMQPSKTWYFHFNAFSHQIRQLFIKDANLNDLEKIDLSNLLRLHFDNFSETPIIYKGAILPKLEILEFSSNNPLTWTDNSYYPGYRLIDFCPSLKSAHFFCARHDDHIDSSKKKDCLQDLVIEYNDGQQEWESIKSFLVKFKKLKHLAIRNSIFINDYHVRELIEMFPDLVLLDLRRCPGITENADYFIASHCRRQNRTIEFKFSPNETIDFEWPVKIAQGDRVCQHFDFMRNCFTEHYTNLPVIMDPVD